MGIKKLMRTENSRPVFLVLDEFTSTPLGQDFVNDLTVYRGFDIHCHFFVQARSEIERVYGKLAAQTIFSQCEFKQFFGCSSLEEANDLSKLIGQHTVKAESIGTDRTSPWTDLQNSISEVARDLYRPEELLRIPRENQFLIIDGMQPVYCQKLPYNQVSPWWHWLGDNPLEGGKLPFDPKVQLDYRRV